MAEEKNPETNDGQVEETPNKEMIDNLTVKQETDGTKTFEMKVDGKTIRMTEEEMKANASLGLASQQRFQQAARTKKEADALAEDAKVAIEVFKDLKKVAEEDDIEAQIRVWDRLGVSKEEQERTLREVYKVDPSNPTGGGGQQRSQETDGGQGDSKELRELKRQLQMQQQIKVEEMNQELVDRVNQGLDNDDKFQELLKGVDDDDVRKARRELAVEVAMETALSRLREQQEMGQTFRPSWIREAAEKGIEGALPTLRKLGFGLPTHHGRTSGASVVGTVGPVEPPKAPGSDASVKDITNWGAKFILSELANQRSQSGT